MPDSSVKDLIVRVIPRKTANEFVKRFHYSGKVVMNSQLHFGVFRGGVLHGVMQFGPSLDKSNIVGLVSGTKWNEFIELNRMAFDDTLPKNSESRALGVALKLIRKNAPHIRWVISFADGMQCGDGTIYRAANFLLTGFSQGSMIELPPYWAKINGGPVAHRLKIQDKTSALSREVLARTGGKNLIMAGYCQLLGAKVIPGYMLRYIYFIDKQARENLTVPVLPFSEIERRKAGMYKGVKRVASIDSNAAVNQTVEGGAIPTATLQDRQ